MKISACVTWGRFSSAMVVDDEDNNSHDPTWVFCFVFIETRKWQKLHNVRLIFKLTWSVCTVIVWRKWIETKWKKPLNTLNKNWTNYE